MSSKTVNNNTPFLNNTLLDLPLLRETFVAPETAARADIYAIRKVTERSLDLQERDRDEKAMQIYTPEIVLPDEFTDHNEKVLSTMQDISYSISDIVASNQSWFSGLQDWLKSVREGITDMTWIVHEDLWVLNQAVSTIYGTNLPTNKSLNQLWREISQDWKSTALAMMLIWWLDKDKTEKIFGKRLIGYIKQWLTAEEAKEINNNCYRSIAEIKEQRRNLYKNKDKVNPAEFTKQSAELFSREMKAKESIIDHDDIRLLWISEKVVWKNMWELVKEWIVNPKILEVMVRNGITKWEISDKLSRIIRQDENWNITPLIELPWITGIFQQEKTQTVLQNIMVKQWALQIDEFRETNRNLWDINHWIQKTNRSLWSIDSGIQETNKNLWFLNLWVQWINETLWDIDSWIYEINETLWDIDSWIYEINETLWDINSWIQQTNRSLWGIDLGIQETNRNLWFLNLWVQWINENLWNIDYWIQIANWQMWNIWNSINIWNQLQEITNISLQNLLISNENVKSEIILTRKIITWILENVWNILINGFNIIQWEIQENTQEIKNLTTIQVYSLAELRKQTEVLLDIKNTIKKPWNTRADELVLEWIKALECSYLNISHECFLDAVKKSKMHLLANLWTWITLNIDWKSKEALKYFFITEDIAIHEWNIYIASLSIFEQAKIFVKFMNLNKALFLLDRVEPMNPDNIEISLLKAKVLSMKNDLWLLEIELDDLFRKIIIDKININSFIKTYEQVIKLLSEKVLSYVNKLIESENLNKLLNLIKILELYSFHDSLYITIAYLMQECPEFLHSLWVNIKKIITDNSKKIEQIYNGLLLNNPDILKRNAWKNAYTLALWWYKILPFELIEKIILIWIKSDPNYLYLKRKVQEDKTKFRHDFLKNIYSIWIDAKAMFDEFLRKHSEIKI